MLKNLNKKIINCYSNYDSHNVKKGYFFYPESIEDLKNIINLAKKYKKKILCIGKSNNWFDTIINNNQFIISLHKLKKKISLFLFLLQIKILFSEVKILISSIQSIKDPFLKLSLPWTLFDTQPPTVILVTPGIF